MSNDLKNTQFVKAKPEGIPSPTYWPFMLAISVVFIGWGLLTIWIISVAGVIGFILSLIGWIKDLLHERTTENGE